MNHPEEHDDDLPIGRILTRREVLALLAGAGGAVFLSSCGDPATSTSQPTTAAAAQPTTAAAATATQTTQKATQAATTAGATVTSLSKEGQTATAAPSSAATTSAASASSAVGTNCVVRPEVTEGPYFKDEKINRSDIRTDTSSGTAKQGVQLVLAFQVSQIANSACTALKGAQVDIWHCDAVGTYSDTSDPNWTSTVGQNYLRGYQVTDDKGAAQFTTIYPGWYSGRTIHIHFKVRTTGTNGAAYEFTSQLFFDDTLSAQILTQAPYNTKSGTRDTQNTNDNIYQSAGSQMQLALTKVDTGYTAAFGLALDLSDTSVGKSDAASQSGGAGGGPGGAPPGGGTPGARPGGTTQTAATPTPPNKRSSLDDSATLADHPGL